jgi:pilus assembly protein CpaF
VVNGVAHPALSSWQASGPSQISSALGSTQLAPAPQQAGFELDYTQLRELHDLLKQSLSADPGYQDLPAADQEQRARSLINQLVSTWATRFASAKHRPVSPDEARAYAQALFDMQYRAGRLQPLLDDPSVENIYINGAGAVWVDRGNGPLTRVGPIASSDAELVEMFRDLARSHGGGERSLSVANPLLALRLPDGSRVQVISEVTPEMKVTIRKHRTRGVTLDDLVRLGTIDTTLMAFLRAAVRAQLNVIVVGSQGVGKTSLLRALIAEIPEHERFATLETEFELYAHEDGVHTQVIALEARQGNGEKLADGRPIGEITLADLIPAALRMTLSRIIVGEVRTSEVLPMLDVMNNSEGGSMCTLHVRRAEQTFTRLASLCRRYSSMDTELAMQLAADAIDLVVHVRMWDETPIGGRRHRYVSHVLEVTGMGERGRPAVNTIFAPREQEVRAVPATTPSPGLRATLQRVGFDPRWLDAPFGTWGEPLTTLTAVV